jgi:hypothetical protein
MSNPTGFIPRLRDCRVSVRLIHDGDALLCASTDMLREIFFLRNNYANIFSIAFNSSDENSRLCKHSILLFNCLTELAPIKTDVIRLSF